MIRSVTRASICSRSVSVSGSGFLAAAGAGASSYLVVTKMDLPASTCGVLSTLSPVTVDGALLGALVEQVLGRRPGVQRRRHGDHHRQHAEGEDAHVQPATGPQPREEGPHQCPPGGVMSTRRTKNPSSVSSNSTSDPGG